MPERTTLEVDDRTAHVRTIRLNRPAQRNAISAALAGELDACLRECEQLADLRAVVVTGKGPAFCAGADLKERLAGGGAQAGRQRDIFLGALERIDRLPAPVIAMINGPALAGGLELALACDIRVAAQSARFGLPEVRTAGAFPGAGGPVRLAKSIGRGRASLVVLTGRNFDAREAFALGIVELLAPDTELEACTQQVVNEIVHASPLGVRAAKQLMRRAADLDLDAGLALSRTMRDPLDETADAAEAVAAWREKRPPQFRGA